MMWSTSAKTTIRLANPIDVRTNIYTFAAYLDNDDKADTPAGRTFKVKSKTSCLNAGKTQIL